MRSFAVAGFAALDFAEADLPEATLDDAPFPGAGLIAAGIMIGWVAADLGVSAFTFAVADLLATAGAAGAVFPAGRAGATCGTAFAAVVGALVVANALPMDLAALCFFEMAGGATFCTLLVFAGDLASLADEMEADFEAGFAADS
jgi:hypothetical protein